MAELSTTPTTITYADPTGAQPFNASRTKRHDAIIEAALHVDFDPKKPYLESSQTPYLLMVGGGHCARKTGMTKMLLERGTIDGDEVYISNNRMAGGKIIDEDGRIFYNLPEFKLFPSHPHPEKTPTLIDEYYHLRSRLAEAAIARRIPVVVEDHFNDVSETYKLIEIFAKAGYKTCLIGSCVGPEQLFSGMQSDAENAGIHADKEWALTTHRDFAINFNDFIAQVDIARLYTVDGETLSVVKKKKERDGITEVVSPELNAMFKNWATANVQAESAADVFDSAHKPPVTGKIGDILEKSDRGEQRNPNSRA